MVRTARYLSAGRLLHAITLGEIITICAMAICLGPYPLGYPALMMLGLFPLFTQLDARSRFQEYKHVRDQLIRFGPDNRIFKTVSRSRCQRDAALAAAGELGYARTCRGYFYAAGYRWHHLLPGFLKSHPRLLVSAVFWRMTFFAPTYQARTGLFS